MNTFLANIIQTLKGNTTVKRNKNAESDARIDESFTRLATAVDRLLVQTDRAKTIRNKVTK